MIVPSPSIASACSCASANSTRNSNVSVAAHSMTIPMTKPRSPSLVIQKAFTAARAAVKAFWITKLGDLGFVIGIVMLWAATDTFEFRVLFALAQEHALAIEGLGTIMFLIYLGAVGKSAQFPLHVWLPDAMEGPTPVSALIHAATMVTAGVFMVTRAQ